MKNDQIAEWFKDHVATLSEAECHLGKIAVLDWRKPGTSIYRVVYLMIGGVLMLYGDLGEASYRWSDRISLGFLASLNDDYFASKCGASEYGRGGEEWNQETAQQALLGWVRDALEQPDATLESAFGRYDWDNVLYNQDSFCQFLSDNEKMSNGEPLNMELCDVGNVGMEPAIRVRAHLIGLKMAAKQLKSANEPTLS